MQFVDRLMFSSLCYLLHSSTKRLHCKNYSIGLVGINCTQLINSARLFFMLPAILHCRNSLACNLQNGINGEILTNVSVLGRRVSLEYSLLSISLLLSDKRRNTNALATSIKQHGVVQFPVNVIIFSTGLYYILSATRTLIVPLGVMRFEDEDDDDDLSRHPSPPPPPKVLLQKSAFSYRTLENALLCVAHSLVWSGLDYP